MMAAAIQNKSIEEVRDLSREFKAMMSIHEETISNADQEPVSPVALTLGDLEALKGVVKFPVRIKCATLSPEYVVDRLRRPRHVTPSTSGARRNTCDVFFDSSGSSG